MAYGGILGQNPDLTDYALKTDLNSYLLLNGGSMSGNINMNNNFISGLPTPTTNDQAVNKEYADNLSAQQNYFQLPTTSNYSFLGNKNIVLNNGTFSSNYIQIPHLNESNYVVCYINDYQSYGSGSDLISGSVGGPIPSTSQLSNLQGQGFKMQRTNTGTVDYDTPTLTIEINNEFIQFWRPYTGANQYYRNIIISYYKLNT